jgi:transcriptional regulator of acetoin/glycerol metabolism
VIELRHLPPEFRPPGVAPIAPASLTSMRSMERHMIEAALKRNNGNRQRTARELGIDPSTLYRKLKALAAEEGM